MTNNNLEELTKKIQKHCPELLELSFGCVFNWKVDQTHGFGGLYTITQIEEPREGSRRYTITAIQNTPLRNIEDICIFDERITTEKDLYEILGHPITLEHVLKAINANESAVSLLLHFAEPILFLGKEAVEWHLGKSLSEQPPELIEWLNQIIV